MADDNNLYESFNRNLKHYANLLIQTNSNQIFWDIVLLTSGNLHQKSLYERQIRRKLEKNEIPNLADPQGIQIGSGGSTLLAMKFLDDTYGSILKQKKVLLIHAGGYSTRLPHVSASGKIFMKIPIERNWIELFDLKLIIYLELINYLKDGTVFLTSSDTIELMSLNAKETSLQTSIYNTPFVALAHPSTLQIGTTHGVYKIQDDCQDDILLPKDQGSFIKICKEYLHKPSIEFMRNHNGIIHLDNGGYEFVYTDSTYFFDYNILKIFLKILDEIQPLTYELEAWSDFLSTKFTNRIITQEISTLEKAQLTILKELYSLENPKLNVLILNNSKFYHMGTMFEYLNECCINPQFKGIVKFTSEESLDKKTSNNGNICMINSHINENTVLFEEFAPIILDNIKVHKTFAEEDKKVIIGGWSILSNIELNTSNLMSKEIRIPNHICMFTLHLKILNQKIFSTFNNEEGFVTFIFGINDDMKAKYSFDSLIIYKNILVHKIIHSQYYKCKNLQEQLPPKLALWNAPIFPMTKTKEQSIKLAIQMLEKIEKAKYIIENNIIEKDMEIYEKDILKENYEIIIFTSLKMSVEIMEIL
ncbi:18709_t:CDS:2 [Funneliformis geosporum]|uniref:18709_t:CDS:1 n=1 Tax=Funneliformis geosporum TaxID=1117311 RepID=A0A9W4SLU4_9GLOM|nr:18709_t:CDS:2 [Funneliformis geosporum]